MNDTIADAPQRLRRKLLSALGPIVRTALDNPDITDIMLNANGTLWITEHGHMNEAGLLSPLDARNAINTTASYFDRIINEQRPTLECELPLNNERFTAIIPPVVDNPTFCIRKHTHSLRPMETWIAEGRITQKIADQLDQAILARQNIIISGGTGTGKTSLANALLQRISILNPDHRLIVVEDTKELKITSKNYTNLRTTKYFNMQDGIHITMRYNPIRIIIGEVRGGEALEMLKNWNTGHPGGIATIHANSCAQARLRLIQMCAEASASTAFLADSVDSVIDCIIQMSLDEITGQRTVTDVLFHEPR